MEKNKEYEHSEKSDKFILIVKTLRPLTQGERWHIYKLKESLGDEDVIQSEKEVQEEMLKNIKDHEE